VEGRRCVAYQQAGATLTDEPPALLLAVAVEDFFPGPLFFESSSLPSFLKSVINHKPRGQARCPSRRHLPNLRTLQVAS
jgi:hypothetical protein